MRSRVGADGLLAEAETASRRAQIQANQEAEVARIRNEMEIRKKEMEKAVSAIQDSMYLAEHKAKSDAEACRPGLLSPR